MKVSIYEWKNEKLSDKIQDIQITYAFRCNTFTIHNITYITCGKGWARRNAVTVLKWSGKQFEPFQDLPSSNVEGRPHIFHANGTVYLAIANFQSPVGYNPDTDSFIYRWNGIKFVHHQSIPTHGAMGWDSFSTAAGEVFLVVANRYTQGYREKAKSAVYKMANNKFNLYQKLPTTWPKYLHAFTHKGKQYLAVTTQVNIIKRAESSVYIWNWQIDLNCNYWQCPKLTEERWLSGSELQESIYFNSFHNRLRKTVQMCHLLLYITASDMRTNYYVSLKKPKKKIDQITKLSVHKIKYIEIEYRIVTRGSLGTKFLSYSRGFTPWTFCCRNILP